MFVHRHYIDQYILQRPKKTAIRSDVYVNAAVNGRGQCVFEYEVVPDAEAKLDESKGTSDEANNLVGGGGRLGL